MSSHAVDVGEEWAQAVFRTHYPAMVRLAMQLVDDQAAAEDVVQEVFAALVDGRPAPDDPVRYLRTAVLNRARSVLRRRKLARALRLASQPDAEPASASTEHRADRERVLAVLGRLPTRQRQVVVLRYYEQLDNAEIARVLGIRPGAVASSLGKAMTRLRQVLEDR